MVESARTSGGEATSRETHPKPRRIHNFFLSATSWIKWGKSPRMGTEAPRFPPRLSTAFTPHRSITDRLFKVWLLLALFIGICIVGGSAFWKTTVIDKNEKTLIFEIGQSIPASTAGQSDSLAAHVRALITEPYALEIFAADIVRDLGVALLIAVFVAFAIEKYSSDRLREDIASNVLSAAYARVVPPEIFTQVRDNVFRSDVCRENWKVDISADQQQPGPDGTAVITAGYAYDVINLKEQWTDFVVVSTIDLDDPPPDDHLPKFISYSVTDDRGQPLVTPDNAIQLMNRPAKSVTELMGRGNLTLQRGPRVMRMAANVRIRALSRITVSFQVKRAIRVPGNYVLTTPVPTYGIDIISHAVGFKLSVVALHPDTEALLPLPGNRWEFRAAMLPWQGFRFVAEKA
jgi:hypothetical protein